MSNTSHDINSLRNIILSSQHLLKKSSDSIENIVSDICGLQYDPYPAIHLNQYMMLWNRKQDFRAEQLDIAAYKEFKIVETWTFKRNMFLIPSDEYSLYKHATKGIVRWGESDDNWFTAGDSTEIQVAEKKLKESLMQFDGLTSNQIWENLNLSDEWNRFRREHDQSYNLPIFRAFYRLVRKGDLLTCGRNPGTFKEPVFILKEKVGFSDWMNDTIDEKEAIKRIVEKLIAWLTTFFDYSFSFEYFKKKGMKWPLSILIGNQFVGYLDCKMEWRTRRFIIKEKNIFNPAFNHCKAIDLAIEELAAFHDAKEIVTAQ